MKKSLTPEEAQEVFCGIAARGDEIAFRWLQEGCECRAQLMIEHLQAMGLEPGRAWVLAVDRLLSFPHPTKPKKSYTWKNHVAPTVPIEGVEYGVMVIDPSISPAGPVLLVDWLRQLRVESFEVSTVGLAQSEILRRQTERNLQGVGLDALAFLLRMEEAPIPEAGGTGFRIDRDPPEGVSAFAHSEMEKLLAKQKMLPPTRP
jgi:hypothetical protein